MKGKCIYWRCQDSLTPSYCLFFTITETILDNYLLFYLLWKLLFGIKEID
jgi:hypothetical protein